MGAAMAEPRFFCDDHLRRLTRWLRAAGYDAAWQTAIDDDDLLARSGAEGRIVLTLDRALARRGACLLPSHAPLEQLRFLKERYALDLVERAFTRCPVCNVELRETHDAEVPERVRAICDRFWRCPECDRTYWHGDHVRHMQERFRSLQ
jgi:uncharacterized protein with PIN domain